MRLRRLSQHVKDQNWFAVALDFIIVVIGVAAALTAQQWLSERQSQSDLARALESVRMDLFRVYFVASERLALVDCRKQRYSELGELLMQTDIPWPGSPREYPSSTIQQALPVVMRSPHRYWTSQIWDAELSKGTFDRLRAEDRFLVASVFSTGAEAEDLQTMIRDLEAGLQALAHPLDLALSDRLRYYDALARADNANSLLEVLATQHIDRIDALNFPLLGDDADLESYRAFIAAQNARLVEIFGDCVVPIDLAFLD